MLLVITFAIIIGTIVFIHGASIGKPEWLQRQSDDEQMEAVSKMRGKNSQNKRIF